MTTRKDSGCLSADDDDDWKNRHGEKKRNVRVKDDDKKD